MLMHSTTEARLPFEDYLSHGTAAGVRWTGRRQDVLRLIWSAGHPIGAYQVAKVLGDDTRSVHPASVYRCLRCLADAGLIIPVLSWRRHVIAPDPASGCWGLLLCKACRSCTPVDLGAEWEVLGRRLQARGFAPRDCSVETQGLCRLCVEREPES